MHCHSRTVLALLATAYVPSALGCVHFKATLHQGANQANDAQSALAIKNGKLSGQDLSPNDIRLDVYMWDDINNDNQVEPFKDIFCTGVDIRPYAPDSWAVPCTPPEKNAELDINYDESITDGGVLVNIYKRTDPKFQSKNFNDPNRDLLFSFLAKSVDGEGAHFETQFACGDCKDSAGRTVKC